MARRYTEARARATAKYQAEKTDTMTVRTPKGTKDRWRAEAEAEGKALQRFIIDAVETHIADKQKE